MSNAKVRMMSGQSSGPVMHDACEDQILTGHHADFSASAGAFEDNP